MLNAKENEHYKLLEGVWTIIEKCFDGKGNVIHFSNSWHVQFGPYSKSERDISSMPDFPTLEEAVIQAIKSANWDS